MILFAKKKIYQTDSIEIAEAAKVIENTQERYKYSAYK